MKTRLLTFGGIMLFVAWLMPNHYPPWASFHAEAMAALALAPLIVRCAFERQQLSPLAIGVLLLSFVPLAQLVVGRIEFAGDAWMAWLYLTGLALSIHAGASIVNGQSRERNRLLQLTPLMVCILMAALISVALAIHQWLDLGLLGLFIVELPRDSRPFANLAQPNQLASLLMLGLAAAVFLYEARALRAQITLVAAALIIVGLVMTQSRTVLLCIAFIWVAFIALRGRSGLRITYSCLVGMTALYAFLAVAWPSINDALLLSHGSSFADRSAGRGLRILLWQSLLDALGMHPWVGWGWGQISFAQQATALNYPPTNWWFESSHNLILDLALWAGAPVAIAVAAGLIAWFLRCAAACRDPLAWALFVCIGNIFCHAMVEFPLSYAYFLLPVGFLMGALGMASKTERRGWQARRVKLPERVFVAALSLTAVVTCAKVISEYLTLEEEWRNLRISRTLVGAEPPSASRDIYILTQLQSRANFLRIDPASNLPDQTLEWMGHVALRYGVVTFMFPYAKALATNGRLPEAERILTVMCRTQMPNACDRAMNEWNAFRFSASDSSASAPLPRGPSH